MGGGGRVVPDHGPALRRRAVAVLRVDDRLRGEAARGEAPPPPPRDPPAPLPPSAAPDRVGTWRGARLPLVARAAPRPPIRGHARALRRGVRARGGADRG